MSPISSNGNCFVFPSAGSDGDFISQTKTQGECFNSKIITSSVADLFPKHVFKEKETVSTYYLRLLAEQDQLVRIDLGFMNEI